MTDTTDTLLGLPPQRPLITSQLGALPRFSRLALSVRAALYGINDARVRRMVDRNSGLDLQQQIEALA